MVKIVTPEGELFYRIQVMKIQAYSIDEIFEKNMYFLIPFYIFTHESQFTEYNTDSIKLNTLKTEYRDIIDRLEAVLAAGKISEYTKCTIVDMAGKVLEHIAQKYENVRKGVKSVMGGKVLEYEAKTIKLEGERVGRLEGRLELLADLVRDGMLSVSDAAAKVELSEEEFLEKMQEYVE